MTKQFSSPHQTLTGYPTNLSQFQYCLPGDSIRFHRLRAQVQDSPHSRCYHKSRISPVLLPNWLQIWGFHDPLLRFDQIATVVHRTQKASLFFSFALFFFFLYNWDLSFLTRVQNCVPCIGSTESQPLNHQGSPRKPVYLLGYCQFITQRIWILQYSFKIF